jgi:hypothetical protein
MKITLFPVIKPPELSESSPLSGSSVLSDMASSEGAIIFSSADARIIPFSLCMTLAINSVRPWVI